MMEGWKEKKIHDFGKVVTGKTPPTKISEYFGEGYAFITPTDLVYDNYYINHTARQVTELARSKFKNYFLPPNSISYTCIGATVGKSCLNRDYVLTNQQINSIIPNEKHDAHFIYYYLNIITPSIVAIAGGAATPIINKSSFEGLKVFIPPLPTQRKIAKILSAYDDLIENNLIRIKLLEEMAQNQFNNWYANNQDFEEVNLGSIIGHEIGGGWGAEEQSDEFSKPAYVIRGTDIDELPNGKLEKVPFRFHKKSNLASRKLQDGDIIFEVSGGSSYEGVAKTLLVTDELLKQFDNAVMPASFCKLARPIERKYSSFLFLFWRFLRHIKGTEVFEIRSASNIVNYNWTAFLKFQKIKKPSEAELVRFNNKVEPIYKQVYKLGNQNQYLKEARDILLPRLMTGMIDVEKLELEL